jgi:MFS family permease
VGGVWSDRTGGGRKKWLVGGYALSALSRPFIALASGPGLVIALRSLDRVGKGLRTAPRDALLVAAVEEGSRGRAFGFHRAMDHTGALIGGLLASGLLAWGLSEREVIGLTIVPGIAAILTVSLLVRERAETSAPLQQTKLNLHLLTPELRRFLPVAGTFALANSSDAFLLLKARETGVSATLLPLLWAWIHVTRIAANLVGGSLADRFGARRTVAAGWLCYGVVYALVAFAGRPWQVWIVLGIYGIYSGLTEGGEKVIVSQMSRTDSRGAAFGVFHFVTGILALPASLLTGWLWDHYGSTVALGTSAILAVMAAGWLVKRK